MTIAGKFLLIFFVSIGLTAISCNSSRSPEKDTDKESIKVEKHDPEPAPPPGQADINATVKDLTENEVNIIADININEVLKYGASTPPLAKGSEIKLFIKKPVKENQEDRFRKGEIILMRVSFSQGMNNNDFWNFISFINK